MEGASGTAPSAAELGRSLEQLFAANSRYRAAVRRRMDMGDNDLAALYHLAFSGPLTPGELARRLRLRSASVTALIDRLEHAGHVRRVRHPQDRRSIHVEITESALIAGEREFAALSADLHAASDRLDGAQRAVVAGWLAEITAGYERHVAGADDDAAGKADDTPSSA